MPCQHAVARQMDIFALIIDKAMYPSEAEIKEMEAFIAGRQLPQTLKLNAATTINDLPRFVKDNLKLLKAGVMVDLVARVRWDDLCQIKQILERNEAAG